MEIEEQTGENSWKVLLMLKKQVVVTLLAVHHGVGEDLIEGMEDPDEWVWVTGILETNPETLAAMNGRVDIGEVNIDIDPEDIIKVMPSMFDLLENEGTIKIRDQRMPFDSFPFLRSVQGPVPTEPSTPPGIHLI
jgi:hypothetical protein